MAGLGNPGPGYAGNRHNVGHMVVDELADRWRGSFSKHKSNAHIVERRLDGGERLVLAKPNTFMNVSGAPVAALARFFKVPLERIVVVHDELDVPFDTVRLKAGGGAGGHNGIKDVHRALGSPDFVRVRVGIGRPPGRMDAAAFVLKDFSADERTALPNLVSDAADAVELVVRDGLVAAQQKVHAPR